MYTAVTHPHQVTDLQRDFTRWDHGTKRMLARYLRNQLQQIARSR